MCDLNWTQLYRHYKGLRSDAVYFGTELSMVRVNLTNPHVYQFTRRRVSGEPKIHHHIAKLPSRFLILSEAHLYNFSGLHINIILTNKTHTHKHKHFNINTTSSHSALCIYRREDHRSYRFLFNGDEGNKFADTL